MCLMPPLPATYPRCLLQQVQSLYRLAAGCFLLYTYSTVYTCISQVRLASTPASRWRRRPWWNSHALSLIAGRAGCVAEAGSTRRQATWPVCLRVSVNLREPTALWRQLPVRAWCGDTSAASHVASTAQQPQRWYAINASWEWCGGTCMLGVLTQCDLIYVHISLTHSVACGAGAWLRCPTTAVVPPSLSCVAVADLD